MRENQYRFAFWLLLAAALIYAFANNTKAETVADMTVRPTHCLAPCTVQVSLHIARDTDNRAWSIAYANVVTGNGEISSGSLAGENTEAVFPICAEYNMRPCFRELREDGDYLFIGCVHRLVKDEIVPVCDDTHVYVATQ